MNKKRLTKRTKQKLKAETSDHKKRNKKIQKRKKRKEKVIRFLVSTHRSMKKIEKQEKRQKAEPRGILSFFCLSFTISVSTGFEEEEEKDEEKQENFLADSRVLASTVYTLQCGECLGNVGVTD